MPKGVLRLQDGWRLAIEREVESHAFYMQLSRLAQDEPTRKLFEHLAAQEVQHQEKLQEEYERYFQTDM